jgi:hypothetical protein
MTGELMTAHVVLLALALACFLLAAIEVPAKVNLVALGLAFCVLSAFF